MANSSKMLIIGRAVGGMGGSGMVNGALNIIAGAVPMQGRPREYSMSWVPKPDADRV